MAPARRRGAAAAAGRRLLLPALLAAAAAASPAGSAAPERTIPAGFVGVSVETNGVADYAATPAVREAYVNVLAALQGCFHAPGEACVGGRLRIGGNSADRTAWMPDGSGPADLPANATVAFTPALAQQVQAIAEGTNGTIVWDLNLAGLGPAWGVRFVEGLRDATGFARVAGIEIGNEVDLYHSNGYRELHYGFKHYVAEWLAYCEALQAAGVVPAAAFVQAATYTSRCHGCRAEVRTAAPLLADLGTC